MSLNFGQIWLLHFMQVTSSAIKSWLDLKFSKIGPGTGELAALEHLEKYPLTYNRRNVVTTLAPSFLIWSSFLKVTRTYIKAWLSLHLGQIPSLTTELAAIECLKNIVSPGFLGHFIQIFLILADNQNWLISLVIEFSPFHCFKFWVRPNTKVPEFSVSEAT